ncbi:glycosyltransferase family 2 protein [Naasia lichenicola]|uniref:Glycosyltransferase n=1 Tax=Naasia lichenicola TaxID=2565933 RepID=A0A4S4FKC8_9MICO|nr:glycosyltransferase [Naasia lichenicola]THG30799.1 glycosyltransferase [Naasia lichenicola]
MTQAPDSSHPLTVVVAALTYKRPHDLDELLPQLVRQAEASADEVRVLIVDNDPDAGARTQIAGFGRAVLYQHAAEPGIAAARNVALDSAGDADLLIFIDDDERPVDDWLALLLDAYRRYGTAGIVGPVISSFESAPEPWITAGRFFDRRRLPTGTPIDIAATNNLLLDLRVINRLGLRFDVRFGITGGSDTLFSRQLRAAGEQMTWCDEAIVTDVVPTSRSTRTWVLQRAYRSGNSWIATSLAMHPTRMGRLRVRVDLGSRGLLRAAAGALLAAAGYASRRAQWQARGRRTLARGRGLLAGALGTVYAEYKRS